MRILKNKRAWIKIVEAFISILLVTGILLMFINQGIFLEDPLISKANDFQSFILNEIQNNDSLREEIINSKIPLNWSDFEKEGLANIKNLIISKTPEYLVCQAKICNVEDVCSLQNNAKSIYAKSIIISATLQKYSPRQLKLFCMGINI